MTETMTVYRVQDKHGDWLYERDISWAEMTARMLLDNSPQMDRVDIEEITLPPMDIITVVAILNGTNVLQTRRVVKTVVR